MRIRPFSVLVAVVAMCGALASCTCSGSGASGQGSGASGAQTTGGGTGTAAAPGMGEKAFRLENGLQVEIVDGPCGDAVGVAVLVNAGVDHDPVGRSGMARLAGRLLAATPEGKAARGVEVGTEYTVYAITTSAEKLDGEIDEVAAWMSKAAPAEADFTRERDAMLAEIDRLSGNDAAGTALRLAEEAVQPTRGNGRRAGVAAEVKAITAEELAAFWKAAYSPGNARIVVAGKVDAEKVKAKISAALGALPGGTPPAVARDPGDTTVKGTLVMGAAPSAIAWAVPAPGLKDPLFAPFLVLASRLVDAPAEGRTWAVTYDPIRRPEVLLITQPVGATEQPEPSAQRMRKEATALVGAPLGADDVARAKERFRLFVEPALTDPALCSKDARSFAIARARRAQLALDAAAMTQALEGVTKGQLDEAAKAFEAKQSAAVIAGGALP